MERAHSKEYAESRERIIELVKGLTDEELNGTVPACPEWRVRDVVAHIAGLTTDVLAGKIDAYGSEKWTSAQVEERKDRSIDEVIAEWEANAERYDGMLEANPGFLPMITTADLVTHEHDIRGALNQPGARDSEGVRIGVKTYVGRLRQNMEDLPPLRVNAVGFRDFMVGKGDPAASVSAETYELFRALGGRRSEEQVRALDWEGDPEPYLPKWLSGPFAFSATALDD
jgi:uncharacterized protein (TIGR03083 family)